LGVSGVCIVEHAFQLYFGEKNAWSYRWQTDRELARSAGEPGTGRMEAYRSFASALREDTSGRGIQLRFGLEVDLCSDGSLLLAEEDRRGWDLLVGAVHKIPDVTKDMSAEEAERRFLRDVDRLLRHPIQVLAHPFRWFRRAKRRIPPHLFAPVARRLAERRVAAEVNYHKNDPNVAFVEECVSRGVKIALGTDAHEIEEAGELHPHLRLLRRAGVERDALGRILYRPR
jgi:putative hydrolase